MHKNKWYAKWWVKLLGTLIVLVTSLVIYLVIVAKVEPPFISNTSCLGLQRVEIYKGAYAIKNSWFRKSKSGLYELYAEGDPFELGVTVGKLTSELVVRQEDHFNHQITKLIPSQSYQHFLKYVIGWFNRNLDKNISSEYKEEIYGISLSASDEYQYIGSNYQRLLNYHAAHDIGHTLQSMALVGCTSFGTWDTHSKDSSMLIGRNFDFYVGDGFAEDKIIAFINPTNGYKFMTVTWGGFIGAVSGMNDQGLTVTINAAKSGIPSGSATPVSLVAREILQYAKNINEAFEIAKKREVFVSESFLISSAQDRKAVLIEKTPTELAMFDPRKDYIISTNHFQSNEFKKQKDNNYQISNSASSYRYKRVAELLNTSKDNTVEKTISILRDQKGLDNKDIGMGNEKAINQLIAHHSIVFEPEKLRVWISTTPWQLGQFVSYDLHKIFSMKGIKNNEEIIVDSLTIPADSFLLTNDCKNFFKFRSYKMKIDSGEYVDPANIVASNPNLYQAYVLAGNELIKGNKIDLGLNYLQQALTKEVATKDEEKQIRSIIQKYSNK